MDRVICAECERFRQIACQRSHLRSKLDDVHTLDKRLEPAS